MDKIQKLFRQISTGDKKMIDEAIEGLRKNPSMRGVSKLSGSDFYRYRKGKFRIIFHIEDKKVIIDSVAVRNEKTYKNY